MITLARSHFVRDLLWSCDLTNWVLLTVGANMGTLDATGTIPGLGRWHRCLCALSEVHFDSFLRLETFIQPLILHGWTCTKTEKNSWFLRTFELLDTLIQYLYLIFWSNLYRHNYCHHCHLFLVAKMFNSASWFIHQYLPLWFSYDPEISVESPCNQNNFC